MSNLLSQASLVMIPSGYKEDVVYSAIPTDGSGDLSFTRASNGTRVNSAGLVEVCPWNMATNSENFSSWNLANVTVTANDITAPNGTLTADKLTISSNANDVKQTISVMPNSVYTWTFYVYGGTALGQQTRFYDNTNSANIEYYDYSSYVVLGAWVKIERTLTTPSGCYEIQAWALAATSTIGTMWVWGAQLNIGSTAKPYFPTTDRLNVPRLTYQNGGGGCPSLLLEKQSTNVFTYSEDFTNAVWNKQVSASVSGNTTISPDGTQNADTLTISAGSYMNQSATLASGSVTLSIYVKVASGTKQFQMYCLENGQVSSTFTATTSWQRFSYTFTITGATAYYPIFVDNVGGGDYQIWGAQIEASSYATSLINTTSSSATRVADACFKTGISSLIGQTNGTVFAEIKIESGSTEFRVISINDGSTSNRVALAINGQTDIRGFVVYGSTVGTAITTSIPSGAIKIAIAYTATNYAFFVNGSKIGTQTKGSFATTLTNLSFDQGNGGNSFFGQDKQLILFPTALTDAECQALTTL